MNSRLKFPAKINLANIPTPIQRVSYAGCSFNVKRDDFTGSETSGNKIRKLEYLLADAVQKKCGVVVTCGGEQSNHARATAAACASLGIPCHLLLWGSDKRYSTGNLFLDKMFGAEISFLNKKDYFSLTAEGGMLNSFTERHKNPYFIPEGGSNLTGIYGYIEAYSEMAYFIKQEKIKGIICAAGTGGTAAGLLIGCSVFGRQNKIYAVNVLYSASELRDKIFALIDEFESVHGIKVNRANLQILDGFSEEGYKKINPEKLRMIKDFAAQSGILLDPVYTGKAFYAYQKSFSSERRKRILFLHSGGLFGAFDRNKKYYAC